MDFKYDNKFSSERNPIFGRKGMVSSTEPKASQAGLEVLKRGGNAIDAAIATAASLSVLDPTSNGLGGDAFAIIYFEGKVYGINGSGPAAKNISIEALKARGFDKIPTYGIIPVNVPGQISVWSEMIDRFGKLSLKEVLRDPIDYIREGFPVSPHIARCWDIAYKRLEKDLAGPEFDEWFKVYSKDGRAYKPGEIFRSEEMARTLEIIGKTNGEDFYRGQLARELVELSKSLDGYLEEDDLRDYRAEWVEPLKVNYRGYDIWELPPNTHGLVVLMALKIFENYRPEEMNLEYYHKMIESMKFAYRDGLEYITDFKDLDSNIDYLLSEAYFDSQYDRIGDQAQYPSVTALDNGGTVYFSTADEDGNMVSFIQSNFMDFGSGLVLPGRGVNLHNRGITFSLDRTKHNCLEPGKKTYHTIIPGFMTKDGQAVGPFGVMGKYMQPQGHFQVVSNLVDFGLNPQEALDKYRWQWIEGKHVMVEKDFPEDLVKGLRDLGHDIEVVEDRGSFGRGQIILRGDQHYIGGTEKRADGYIAPF